MGAATDSFEADIINYFLRNQVVTQPTTIYLALSSTVPIEDGSNFTELSGNGYARVAITLGAPSAGVTSNTAAVTFGPATGSNWTTVVAVGVFFASSGGTAKLFKQVSSKTVNVGNSLTWGIGDLAFTVD